MRIESRSEAGEAVQYQGQRPEELPAWFRDKIASRANVGSADPRVVVDTGPRGHLEMVKGDWLVRVADALFVLGPDEFERAFKPAEE